MQPNLFTIILRHPDADTICLIEQSRNDITAVALGASPVRTVAVFPMNAGDEFRTCAEIEAKAHTAVLATACKGGFSVECITTRGETPKWAQEVILALDVNERAKRAERRLAAAKAAIDPDVLRVDQARERARGVVLPHPECKELFELGQRARLVGA